MVHTHTPFCTQTLLHTHTLLQIDRNFYTQTLLHTDTLTQKPFATQKLRQTDPIYIYTETLLHTNPFTPKHFYTQKLLHTHTHRHTHTPFCTRTLLHTDPLTHRQKLLHTNPFTHEHFDTETLWHTEAATHGPHLHTDPLTHKRLHSHPFTSNTSYIAILPRFLHIEPRFVQNSCSGTSKIAILPQFLCIDPHFVRNGCSRTSPAQVKSQFYLSFWRSTLISCEMVAHRNFTSVFDDRPSFRAKGLLQDKSGTSKIAILPQFLTIDPHFVRKGCSRTSPAQVKSQFYLSFWRSNLVSCERVDVSWLPAGTTLGLKRVR